MNQAPPGAQQLTRPDFTNVPQFGHTTIPIGIVSDVITGILDTSNRAGHCRGDDERHTVDDIDPDELENMSRLVAFELTQADPQSC